MRQLIGSNGEEISILVERRNNSKQDIHVLTATLRDKDIGMLVLMYRQIKMFGSTSI